MAKFGETHSKITRWIEVISEYHIECHHKPNTDKLIYVVDGLSRLHPNLQGPPNPEPSEKLEVDVDKWRRQIGSGVRSIQCGGGA